MTVLAVEREFNAAGFTNGGVNRFQTPPDVFKGHRLQQREVKVFRKPVVAKVAALEGRPSFEGKAALEIAVGQPARNQARQ